MKITILKARAFVWKKVIKYISTDGNSADGMNQMGRGLVTGVASVPVIPREHLSELNN